MRKESKNPEECSLIGEGDKGKPVSPCNVLLLTIILLVVITGIGLMTMNYRIIIKSSKSSKKLPSFFRGHSSSEAPQLGTKIKISKNSFSNDEMCNKFQRANKNFTGVDGSNISAGIFFITDDGLLTDQDSCSIESALKSLPHEKIYLLELLCGNRPKEFLKGTNYSELLAGTYDNFFHISIEGKEYFKDSPLKGKWECDNQMSLFGAMVLTAWAFGSPTFLPEVIINRPDLLATDGVSVSQFVILDSKKCDDFLYNILESIKIDKNATYIPRLLTEGFNQFKKENPTQVVNILDKTHMCNHINQYCVFIIIEDLKKQSASWSVSLSKFCPLVIKDFQERKQRPDGNKAPSNPPAHRKCTL